MDNSTKIFRGVNLMESEVKLLKKFEYQLNENFKKVDLIDQDTHMGFTVDNNNVIGLSLSRCFWATIVPEYIFNFTF